MSERAREGYQSKGNCVRTKAPLGLKRRGESAAAARKGLPHNRWGARVALFALCAGSAWGQLPDGPGKAATEKVCSQCHELARSISLRQDRAGWEATVNKMVGLGATASDAELKSITDYLTAHYAGEEMPRINVNKARAIDLESGLGLRRSESAAIIEYRTKHGPFKSIEDLKKVPNIDAAKIEAKKDRLTFE